MKIFGIGIKWLILIFFFITKLNTGYSQCNPTPVICNENDCGDVEMSLVADANNVFCQGEEVEIYIDENTSADFDILIFYWCDGTVDTLNYFDQPGTHVYNIPEDEICSNDKTDYFMQIIGVKSCGDEYSCRTIGVSLAITHEARAFFNVPTEGCVDVPLNFSNSSCNAESYLWTFGDGTTSTDENPSHSYSSTGSYPVKLTVSNECGEHSTTHTINILGIPEVDVMASAVANDGIICLGQDVTFTDVSNQWATNTTWNISPSGDSNWEFTDTLMTLNSEIIEVEFKKTIEYTIELSTTTPCGTDDTTIVIMVLDGPTVILQPGPTYCASGSYTPDVNYNGTIDSYMWTFEGGTPGSSTDMNPSAIAYNTPGTYDVTLVVNGSCGELTKTTTITVDADVSVSITAPIQYCQGDAQDTLTSNVSGGTWSGSGIIDAALGIFDPGSANLGSNEITYNYGFGACSDEDMVTILVLESGDGILQSPNNICDSGPYSPSISYSGDITSYSWVFEGASPSSSTDANPTNVQYNTPGTYDITLVISSACGDITLMDSIIVDELISVTINSITQYCQGSSPDTLEANVQGGSWSGTGITDSSLGIFDPMIAGVGSHNISYTYGSGVCEDVDEVSIVVVASETVMTDNLSVCENELSANLIANPSGGTWSGVNVTVTGVFDVQTAGVGTHTVLYNFIDANNCEIESTASIDVQMTPNVGIQDTTFLCVDGGVVDLTLSTLATTDVPGGDYSYLVDGVETASDFTIGSTIGSVPVEVIYTVGACTVSDSAILTLITPPTLLVGPLDTSVCISGGNVIFQSNPSGGIWSGTGINSSTGEVDLVALGGGSYNFNYTFQENTSCEVQGTTSLEIIDPTAGLTAGIDVFICEGDYITYMLDGASPSDGYWSGLGIVDSLTGMIDINTLEVDSLYTYNYCLDYTEYENCEACASRTLLIYPLPQISYGLVGGACIGESFMISDSTLYGDEYHWDFGDGSTSDLQEPTHSYTSSGDYDIVLTVISSQGCESKNTKSIYVSRPPVVQFDLESNEGCADFEVELTNNSYGDDIIYEWLVANDTFRMETPENIVLNPITKDSIFLITLNLTNTCGTVSQTEEILVHPYPVVDIGLSVDEGCSPVTIEFGNNTLGNPEDYIWDLGNGVSSSDSIPSNQTYITSDTLVTIYDITLISSNECGRDTGYQQVTVYPPDVKAFLSIDTTFICQFDSFHVASFSTPGSIITWSVFDSNNQQIEGYNGEDIWMTIDEPGDFMIVLYASRCGTDSDTALVNVLPAPEVLFELPPFICEGDSLHILNNSPSLSETIWDFGDGNTSNDYNPSHVFDTAGLYIITLEGYSTVNNCPRKISHEIEVIGRPIASFIPSDINGCKPLTIDFQNTSIGGTSYNWVWNDGSSASLIENPEHTFNDPGTYTVQLTTFDDFGCFGDTAIVNITVYELPQSAFETDKDSYCQFYDSIYVTNNSIDDITYQWMINGLTSYQEMPVLPAQEVGFNDIILIVKNIYGCVDSSQQNVEIKASPIADFSPSDSVGCQPFNILFDNKSFQSDKYVWNIRNTEVSSDNNLNFTFEDHGMFDIELISKNSNNCPNDTASFNVLIKEKPIAQFTYTKDSICGVPMNVTFQNSSTNDIIDYHWEFGNGITDQIINPTILFEDNLDYTTSLIVENINNCFDTTTQTIPIWHQPKANISIDKYLFCEGDLIVINNNSQHVNEYKWIIGSQDTITTFSPEFIVDRDGEFSVELIVSYNEYCNDTTMLSDKITVFTSPYADFDFTIDRDENLIGDVEFTNLSEDFTSLEWNLGDGNYSSEDMFVHEYDINRGIEVILFAINDNQGKLNCYDSISKIVEPEWLTKYFVPNAFSPDYGIDEVNLFTPKGIGVKSHDISVYSPWGKRVWHSTALDNGHPSESWNGLINNIGKEAPQGSYSWLAKVIFVDGNVGVYKGNVVLLR